jgi:REP element-mobilizing transposase RayT
MGQSLGKLFIHLTFGTKKGAPFITPALQPKLELFIDGILEKLESPSIHTHADSDHLHILFSLSMDQALETVVKAVKKQSTQWMSEQGLDAFAWQTGYAAFTVSSSNVDYLRRYILNQQEHHQKISFQEEMEEFMRHYQVAEYDGKYFWN